MGLKLAFCCRVDANSCGWDRLINVAFGVKENIHSNSTRFTVQLEFFDDDSSRNNTDGNN